jgi:uncharacterized protein (DUF2236 family)
MRAIAARASGRMRANICQTWNMRGVTPQQREQYYRESQLFAGLFGIPKECLPQDWTAFANYFSAMLQSEILSVSERTRTMARRLIFVTRMCSSSGFTPGPCLLLAC